MLEFAKETLPYISPSALPLVVVICFYVKLKTDRKATRETRNNFERDTDKRVTVLEERVRDMDELKTQVSEMNKTLNELAGMFKVFFNKVRE